MGPAASAYIRSRHRHNTHRPVNFLFTPVFQRLQFPGAGVFRQNPFIGQNHGIGLPLRLRNLLLRKQSAEIHSDKILPHVKADIVIAMQPVHNPGENMLPGMLLHVKEAALPVYPAVNQAAWFQGL